MDLKKYVQDIFKLLSTDEDFLRLIIYKPNNRSDNPLDPNKPNIMDMDAVERYQYIDDRIVFTPSTDNLDDDPKCRVVIRTGKRKTSKNNFKTSSQEIIFDVLAHKDFNDVDVRCNWICDYINDLIFDGRVIGINNIRDVSGSPLNVSVKDYIGYQLVFDIGSVN